MELEKLNIFDRMSHISTELMTVAKNLEVGVGSSKYKAVGEADVLRAVKPLESKYRVYSYPISRRVIESGVLETEGVDYKTKERVVKKQLYERIETTYRFVNIDNPSDYIEIISFADGIDSGDKSTGKAMTYSDKYALLKAYKIVTGDDPDQYASEELRTFSPLIKSKIKELNLNLEGLANYLGKEQKDLTEMDLIKAIGEKERRMKGNSN